MTDTPKSPEPTAVGACSSAVAVRAASRRWLSFFRWPHYAIMVTKLIIFASCLTLVGCTSVNSGTTTGTWRASKDNGDKPGIGIELSGRTNAITGRMFLLQPDRPHDFAAGSPRQMHIHGTSDTQIRFAVDWLPSVHDEMVLRLSSPLQGQRVQGILQTINGSGAPIEYEFVRIK